MVILWLMIINARFELNTKESFQSLENLAISTSSFRLLRIIIIFSLIVAN